jgi:hypothetical protein
MEQPMSLSDWAKAGWLKPHKTNRQQITDLFAVVDRDITESGAAISPDWQFGIAYNAALKLCTVVLFAEGWRPENNLAHYRTIQAMPHILGPDRRDDADYLDTCRKKRNVAEYETVGQITANEAGELADFARGLRDAVVAWLERKHPDLSPWRRE